MTKAQELAWLDHAIKELGPHTYLGGSFIDQRASIEANILNDFPAIDIAHCHQDQMRLRADIRELEKEHIERTNQARALDERKETLESQIRELEGRKQDRVRNLHATALDALMNLRSHLPA